MRNLLSAVLVAALLLAAPAVAQDNTIQGLFGPRSYHSGGVVDYPPVADLNQEFVALFGPPPEMRVLPGETYRDAQARRVQYYQQVRNFKQLVTIDPASFPFYNDLVTNSFEYGLGMPVTWADVSGNLHVTFAEAPVHMSYPIAFAARYVGLVMAQAQTKSIRAGGCFAKLWPQFIPPQYRKQNEANCAPPEAPDGQ